MSEPYFPANQFAAQQYLLRERLSSFLNELSSELRYDVRRALEEPGKLFSQRHETQLPAGVWSLLPLFVTQYVDPNTPLSHTVNVALAIECLLCALDLLDDIEDGDQTLVVQDLGIARVLNTSTALLHLSQHLLLSLLGEGLEPTHLLKLLALLNRATNTAIESQHLDVLSEHKSIAAFTREDCIAIASGKAGALMQVACQIGATLAHADDIQYMFLSEMGLLLGIAHQLDNDSHGLYHLIQETTITTDSAATSNSPDQLLIATIGQKKILPLVIAAQVTGQLPHPERPDHEQVTPEALKEGVMTTWGMSLLYREYANEYLQKLTEVKPVGHELRFLLGFK